MGCGGQITVKFSDNDLVDGDGGDLRIFEPGDNEAFRVEISVDGTSWRELRQTRGGNTTFEIASVAKQGERFRFVRITDLKSLCEGARPGADIDAVEALNFSIDAKPSDTNEASAPDESDKTTVKDKPDVDLVMEMTPFHTAPGPTTGFSGEPLDTVIMVTNKGKSRAFAPRLKIEFSGKAVSAKIRIKAQPAKPRRYSGRGDYQHNRASCAQRYL